MSDRGKSTDLLISERMDAKKEIYDGTKTLDAASRAMIFDGVTLNQMTQLFRMDTRTILRRIHSVKPIGRRRGADIYLIPDVVPHLWKPSEQQVEEAIRRMNHQDLPKALTKEYWAGQRSKQDYLLKRGDLWETEKIVERVGELYKLVKMSMLLMSDAVERQTELTDRQRNIIRQLSRSLLEDLDKKIKLNFKAPPPEFPKHQEVPDDSDDEEL